MSFRRVVLSAVLLCGLGSTTSSGAAYISELFQSGPAGQAVEITGIGSTGATLAIIDAGRFNPSGFGRVLEVLHLEAGMTGPVALISDQAWPNNQVDAIPFATLGPASSNPTLNLGFDRLLVVFDGQVGVQLNDNPLTTQTAADRFETQAVGDWLAIGAGDLGAAYQANAGFNLATINQTLGIDLLARIADRDGGSVIARTNAPGQPLDLGTAFVGEPDGNGRFDVGGGFAYRTTPGVANLPLIPVPEPSAGLLLLAGMGLAGRGRR